MTLTVGTLMMMAMLIIHVNYFFVTVPLRLIMMVISPSTPKKPACFMLQPSSGRPCKCHNLGTDEAPSQSEQLKLCSLLCRSATHRHSREFTRVWGGGQDGGRRRAAAGRRRGGGGGPGAAAAAWAGGAQGGRQGRGGGLAGGAGS